MFSRENLFSLVLGIISFTLLASCSAKNAASLNESETARLAAAENSAVSLSGQLSLQNDVTSVAVNVPVTFNLVASGATNYRFVRSDNGSAILFSTSVAYTKVFRSLGIKSESGVLQSLDASGAVLESITLSTPPFSVVSAPPVTLQCASLTAAPTVISTTANAEGKPSLPATFQFRASTNVAATLKSVEILSGVPIQLGSTNPNPATSYVFYGTVQEFGQHTVKATFATSQNETAFCQTNIELRAIPTATPPPRCTATATPRQVMEGQSFTVAVSSLGGPTSEIIVDGAKLPEGATSVPLVKPVGIYTIGVVVNGPGGSGSCTTSPVQVVVAAPVNPPSCNFSFTRYPSQALPVGASLVLSLSLNSGSSQPTSVLIDGVAATKTQANRWDRTITFANPGTFTIEGRVSNEIGTGICWSSPISVIVAPILPTCSLTLSAPSAVEGSPITATLTHTNASASGDATLASLAYAGSIKQTAIPYPSYVQSFLVKYPSGIVTGTVQTPSGVGFCSASFVPVSTCNGLRIGGGCWYLGGYGQSCSSVCAARGGYDLNSALYGDTPSTCTQLMSAFRLPNPAASIYAEASGLSCFFYYDTNSAWLHPTGNPTASAAHPSARRACSCYR